MRVGGSAAVLADVRDDWPDAGIVVSGMSQESPPVSTSLWLNGPKRVFDVVGACSLILLLSPVLLGAALVVKLTSRGPLFFMQERGGKDGVVFRPFKFRTMRGGRRPDPKELVPLVHPDITPVGWFLRRYKIDELPQLLNVVTGEMSLVGPRPTLPDQVAAYDAFRRQRLLVRPGLTGLAQVNSNADVSWDERILFDIAYVRRCGLLLDLGIMLRTVLTILLGEKHTTRPFGNTEFASHVTPPEGYGR